MDCKTILTFATAGTVLSLCASVPVPQVSDVSMRQTADGDAIIDYNLSAANAVVTLDIQTNAPGGAWASIGGNAVSGAQGDVWKAITTGSHRIKWNATTCWADHQIPMSGIRAVVTAWALDNTPDYMAVDVSAGAQPNTQTYYPSADFVPGGVTNSLYKTTILLMRKIMAKDVTWTMGSTALEAGRLAEREATHRVTLTNNYYIGVYEVTQSQWSQVAPNSTATAYFKQGDRYLRPMEQVCYNEIRLASGNANVTSEEISNFSWPKPPCSSSFLGLLRSRTGLDFDLPSDAQWEFAARAGNGSGYWSDGSSILNKNPDTNLDMLGCYRTNVTAVVGSYAPSRWGLYDMHGNVWEWCLDWYEDNISAYDGCVNINLVNPAQIRSGNANGSLRVAHGGSWYDGSDGERPARRMRWSATYRDPTGGLRVVCTAGLR